MTTRSPAQREAALNPTLLGLAELTARITALRADVVAIGTRQGPSSRQAKAARSLLRVLAEARQILAIDLMQQNQAEEEVMLKAGVSYRVLEQWCAAAEDPSLSAWHRVALRAEEARAARLTAEAKRGWRRDLKYRQTLEDLKELKRDYHSAEGHTCEPFTQNSSAEIDTLQALLDGWFVVSPELWTEAEFLESHGISAAAAIDNVESDNPNGDGWTIGGIFKSDDFDLEDETIF